MNTEEVKRLLPWYVVGALDADERREVEHELGRSAELRRELAEVRVLQSAVRENGAEVPEFRASLLDEAMQRIDALEQSRADSRPRATVTSLERFRRALRNDWKAASAVTRFALAAQFALIFVLAGFLLLPAISEQAGQTASGPESVAPAAGIRFNVIFAPDASMGQIAEFLDAQGLRIVSGPTGQQIYVVLAPEQANRDQTLQKLWAAEDLVRFADPATP